MFHAMLKAPFSVYCTYCNQVVFFPPSKDAGPRVSSRFLAPEISHVSHGSDEETFQICIFQGPGHGPETGLATSRGRGKTTSGESGQSREGHEGHEGHDNLHLLCQIF
jgi:hypothetical protein